MNSPRATGVLMIGDYALKFDRYEIGDQFKEIAGRELRETPEVRKAAVAALRELIRGTEDFNFPLNEDEGDEILLRFLRPCKFYPESALKKIKQHFLLKFNNPIFFEDWLCKEDQIVFNQNMITVVPSRDQHGRCIIQIEAGTKWDPKKCNVTQLVRGLLILINGANVSPEYQISGVVVILDVKGLSLTHVLQFTPHLAMLIITYIQECFPFRLKAIHVVNQGYFFKMIFALFKPFLEQKLRNRLHFHGQDWRSIQQHIDVKSLPKAYGGDLNWPAVPGTMLFDLLSYHKKDYERLATIGYSVKPKC